MRQLKAFRKLRGKPVSITFGDELALDIGGGIESGEPNMVLLFLDLDSSWIALQWEWSGQVFMIPTSDVVCIAADL